jgi:hypothetical protein
VDDCKILHITSKVVDKTIEWLQSEFNDVFKDGTGQMKVHCGKTHKYLGMSFDFSHPNQCRITMIDYVDEIVVTYDKAPKDLSDGFNAVPKKKNVARTSVAPDDLFIVDENTEKLSEDAQWHFTTLLLRGRCMSASMLDWMSVRQLHSQLLGLELQMSMTGGG